MTIILKRIIAIRLLVFNTQFLNENLKIILTRPEKRRPIKLSREINKEMRSRILL